MTRSGRGRRRARADAPPAGASPRRASASEGTSSPSLGNSYWLLPALAAVAVYGLSARGSFLYDDIRLVVENPGLRNLGRLRDVFAADPARPLLALSFAFNYAWSGLEAWSYHIVNVFIHAIDAALVARLLAWVGPRLSGRPTQDPWCRRGALLGGCFFAITPMAAEAACYVASRSTTLAAAFMLASLLVAAPALEARSPQRVLVALGLLVLALLTKEEAASVPLLLLILDAYAVARLDLRALASRWRIHLPFWGLLLAGLLARRLVTGAWLPAPFMSHARYLLTQAAVFARYAGNAFVPLDPSFYRDVPAATWPPSATDTLLVLASAALVVAAWRQRRRWPQGSLAVVWLAAVLVPSSTVLPLKQMMVDHRAYLGGVGVALVVGEFVAVRGRGLFTAGLFALLAANSFRYVWVMTDPQRAWEDAVRHAPYSAEAWYSLSEIYTLRRDHRAEAAHQLATQLAPGDARAWVNLGWHYVQVGQLEKAEAATRHALQIAPDDSRLHDNLGLILENEGRGVEARAAYEQAVASKPALARARIDLARLLAGSGERAQALALLQEATTLTVNEQDVRDIDTLRSRLR